MHKVISLVVKSGEAGSGFLWHRFNLPFEDRMLFLAASWKSQAKKTICRFHALNQGGDALSTPWETVDVFDSGWLPNLGNADVA
jgi:hypothetical protein